MHWGTSLCWWANVEYPQDVKMRLLDMIFGDTGLGMKTARYNLGGGHDPSKKQNMRQGALAPCILRDGVYDLQFDKCQIEILDEAVKRGVNQVELFCNSPPWWMTKSGFTNGSTSSFDCNLKPECVDEFVEYLVNCYKLLKERYPVVSLAPFNEPSNPYWTTDVNQEGCYFDYKTRGLILKKLKDKDKNIKVSAGDEFSSGFALAWYIFSPRHLIDKVNVHGYRLAWKNITFYFDDFGIWRYLLRGMTSKPIWMSEYGYGYNDTVEDNLKLARKIFRDLRTLKPTAWVYWQAVENLGWSNWGLLQVNFSDPKEIKESKQYHIIKHFTKTLGDDDKYRVISKCILEITNGHELKYILLNDSNKKGNVILRLDPKKITSCKISNSDAMYVDYNGITNKRVCIPPNTIISVTTRRD
jgi:hypothetical protein